MLVSIVCVTLIYSSSAFVFKEDSQILLERKAVPVRGEAYPLLMKQPDPSYTAPDSHPYNKLRGRQRLSQHNATIKDILHVDTYQPELNLHGDDGIEFCPPQFHPTRMIAPWNPQSVMQGKSEYDVCYQVDNSEVNGLERFVFALWDICMCGCRVQGYYCGNMFDGEQCECYTLQLKSEEDEDSYVYEDGVREDYTGLDTTHYGTRYAPNHAEGFEGYIYTHGGGVFFDSAPSNVQCEDGVRPTRGYGAIFDEILPVIVDYSCRVGEWANWNEKCAGCVIDSGGNWRAIEVNDLFIPRNSAGHTYGLDNVEKAKVTSVYYMNHVEYAVKGDILYDYQPMDANISPNFPCRAIKYDFTFIYDEVLECECLGIGKNGETCRTTGLCWDGSCDRDDSGRRRATADGQGCCG